jgi:hypothetical protein
VARRSTVTEAVEGTVSEVVGAEGERAIHAYSADGSLGVTITSRRGALSPEDLSVTLHRSWQRSLSSFATSNCKGEHMVPALSVTSCPTCGHREEQDIPASEVEVHVVGPMDVSETEQQDIQEKLEETVSVAWGFAASGSVFVNQSSFGHGGSNASQVAAPVPFVVSRHGEKVAVVDAAVLEKAAARDPELNRALGWDEEKGRNDGNGKRITVTRNEGDDARD